MAFNGGFNGLLMVYHEGFNGLLMVFSGAKKHSHGYY